MEYPGNPSPSDNNNYDNFDPFEFELPDYLVPGGGPWDEIGMENMETSSLSGKVEDNPKGFVHTTEGDSSNNIKDAKGLKEKKIERGMRVAFRTKSELEIMDDGYKWRKYGKKSVKNSPNPRNYYKCSSGGCMVKKRVERDREDSDYVVTTYDGVHNHQIPSYPTNYSINNLNSNLLHYNSSTPQANSNSSS